MCVSVAGGVGSFASSARVILPVHGSTAPNLAGERVTVNGAPEGSMEHLWCLEGGADGRIQLRRIISGLLNATKQED